jgi:hypothetical protein
MIDLLTILFVFVVFIIVIALAGDTFITFFDKDK